ncbi:hypothetical protein [Paractinoplanes globisporus]|uniref:DUF3558 domain-containing protein n=1 Tax=Paractinoplanes globisporus TaxID=113565 RepID=A0ABW6WEW4_9ACTN|nr:hypothetical protein [Actinoplanes globisporus]
MHHRSPARRVTLTLAALTALGLGLTACGDGHRTAAGPSPRPVTTNALSASPPPASAAPDAPRTYQATRDACAALDQTLLTGALGQDAGNLGAPRSETNSFATFARCQRQYGPRGDRSLVSLDIMIVKQDTAQTYYEGVRGAHQKSETITDIPGLGHGAYRYNDAQTGPHVVVYDGNLYLSISLIGDVTAASAGTAADLLEQIAGQAMTRLRQ